MNLLQSNNLINDLNCNSEFIDLMHLQMNKHVFSTHLPHNKVWFSKNHYCNWSFNFPYVTYVFNYQIKSLTIKNENKKRGRHFLKILRYPSPWFETILLVWILPRIVTICYHKIKQIMIWTWPAKYNFIRDKKLKPISSISIFQRKNWRRSLYMLHMIRIVWHC